MHESQFSIFLFSVSSTFDNMHGDMQSLSLGGRQFLASTGWRKFGKLDFMCQQNGLFLKAFEEPARVGWGWIQANGTGYMDPETGLEKCSSFTQDQMCIY